MHIVPTNHSFLLTLHTTQYFDYDDVIEIIIQL